MKNKLLLLIVFIQLAVIIFLGQKIYKKTKNIQGAFSINPILKETLDFNPTDNLKYFYEPKPNVTVINEFPEALVKYRRSNSDGLYDIVDHDVDKKDGVYRIIALGDSFTMGAFIEAKDSWPYLLAKELNNKLTCGNIKSFEIINLAVGGYDIQYAVERFKRKGVKYNPDIVIWFLKNDDFSLINEYYLPREEDLLQKLGVKKNSLEYFYNDKGPYPGAGLTMQSLHQELGIEKISEYQNKAIYEIRDYYKNKLVIFTFPFMDTQYKSIIKEFASSNLNSYFYSNLINIYNYDGTYLSDRHPTPKGYSLIAQNLFSYLTKEKIIACD